MTPQVIANRLPLSRGWLNSSFSFMWDSGSGSLVWESMVFFAALPERGTSDAWRDYTAAVSNPRPSWPTLWSAKLSRAVALRLCVACFNNFMPRFLFLNVSYMPVGGFKVTWPRRLRWWCRAVGGNAWR